MLLLSECTSLLIDSNIINVIKACRLISYNYLGRNVPYVPYCITFQRNLMNVTIDGAARYCDRSRDFGGKQNVAGRLHERCCESIIDHDDGSNVEHHSATILRIDY